ncbi:Conserved hypothetical protein [Methylocystis sp. SC2]|nr:Conserved hypothetical protein [Methylocystis sp. SC2]
MSESKRQCVDAGFESVQTYMEVATQMADKSSGKSKGVGKKNSGVSTVGKTTTTDRTHTNAYAVKPALLAGGNPQIPKGYGDAFVQAYIVALPGWKQDVGRRLDRLIIAAVPEMKKAVKWNSPFYGVEDNVWSLSFHCFTKYVRVAFFRGADLTPPPPGASTQKHVRYLDIHEGDAIDEAQFADWVRQASRLPGEKI